MSSRKQPRRISRELAILSLSQISGNPEKLEQQDLDNLLTAATKTLTEEINYALEVAAAEVRKSNDHLFGSELRASTLDEARSMLREALELTQNAINRLGAATELPLFISIANQAEVRQYAIELIGTIHRRHKEIEQQLEESLKDWQLSRLPQIDRDILRLAVAEMMFLDIPQKVAINEAVELAKRYSDEEGYRFINGVLRRVTDRLKSGH
jgi:N utilization substance protein B